MVGKVDHRIGHTVLDYDIAEFYCKWITLVIVVASALIAMIQSSPLCICVYRNRWYVSHIEVVATAMVMSARRVKFDLKCKYDAFVSYDCQSQESIIHTVDNGTFDSSDRG